jgi:hypothetical protein
VIVTEAERTQGEWMKGSCSIHKLNIFVQPVYSQQVKKILSQNLAIIPISRRVDHVHQVDLAFAINQFN